MSDLQAFMQNSYVIKRDTPDHEAVVGYIKEVFEALNDRRTTILVTEGRETVKSMGVTDPTMDKPQGELTQAVLMAQKYSVCIELSTELLEPTETVNLPGFLAMSAGRALGNHLHVSALDGEGELVVRFADNFDITVTRYQPEMAKNLSTLGLAGFEITVHADVARMEPSAVA